MKLAALLALLSGCTFVRVRYHEGAERSAALACFPPEEDPHALECYDYVETRLRQRSRETRL